MNRSTASAIAVAAVLGITGGTWAGATVGTDGDPAASSQTRSPSPSQSRTTKSPATPPSATSPAQLLYMDPETINDGYTHIDVEGFDLADVANLVRIRAGWLVVERVEPGGPEFRATKVDVTGESTELGDFTGSWDISLDGDLMVGLRGRDYTVIDLASGEPLDVEVDRPPGSRPAGQATFIGPAILTAWTAEDGTTRSLRTELASGRTRVLETGTLKGWTASPGGFLIAGQVSNGAISCLRGGSLSKVDSWWTACDWAMDEARPKYSPNGEQLLVVPLDPDSGPPASYGVLASGSGALLGTIDAPPLAVDAEWGDNNEIFVMARKSERNPAGVLYRCQVGSGECTLERPATGPLVLGVGV